MDVMVQCAGVAFELAGEYWPHAVATIALWLGIGERLARLARPNSRTAKVLGVLAARVKEPADAGRKGSS